MKIVIENVVYEALHSAKLKAVLLNRVLMLFSVGLRLASPREKYGRPTEDGE